MKAAVTIPVADLETVLRFDGSCNCGHCVAVRVFLDNHGAAMREAVAIETRRPPAPVDDGRIRPERD